MLRTVSTTLQAVLAISVSVCLIMPANLAFSEPDPNSEVEEMIRQAQNNIKAVDFLQKAKKDILGGRYEKAEEALKEALSINPQDTEVHLLLQDVQVETAQRVSKKAVKEKARQDAIAERIQKKIDDNLDRAEQYLAKGDYENARYYAYKSRAIDPTSPQVASFITKLDKKELSERFASEDARRPKRLERAAKKAKTDVLKEYDERKTWGERITEVFKRKKYQLGKFDDERVYTINECVDIALRRSLRTRMAERQLRLAEMRVWEGRRDLLPTVAGKYETSTGQIGANSLDRHYRGHKYQVEIKQTLFDGMGGWYAVRQAQVNLEVVTLERDKVKNEVIEETKKGYYSLDKAIKSLEIQGSFRKEIGSLYDIIDKAYQQDIIPRVEFLKVKAQDMQADFQVTSAGEDLKLAEMILFQAMSIEPEKSLKIEKVESPSEKPSIGLNNCYEIATTNRPDFRIKAKMIEYYNFERKMKKAKGWPKIDFNGSFGAAYENYEPLSIAADYVADASGPMRAGRELEAEWYAGIKGSVPLWGNTFEYNYVWEKWAPTVSSFRGSRTATSYFTLNFLDDLAYFSNLEEARVGFERTKYEYDKAEKDLLVEVKELYFKYRKSLLQMNVADAQLDHQKTLVRIFQERHGLNELETSRLIEELIKLAEYEYGIVQSEADFYISLTELNKAVGVPGYFRPAYETLGLETTTISSLEEVKRSGK